LLLGGRSLGAALIFLAFLRSRDFGLLLLGRDAGASAALRGLTLGAGLVSRSGRPASAHPSAAGHNRQRGIWKALDELLQGR